MPKLTFGKTITLVTSRFHDDKPDLLLLQEFEQFCAQNSQWIIKRGPSLFAPVKISTRLYTALHFILRPILRYFRMRGAVISLGLPYRIYLFSKTFPYFTCDSDLRVLWTYDVWEPQFKEFERLVRDSGVNLLLLSSFQATRYFRQLQIPDCKVHWVPETIDVNDYQVKPWKERTTNILSFGRSYLEYHDKIVEGCKLNGITYKYQPRNDDNDVAVHGLHVGSLQFQTWEEFVEGLADAQICVCFPRSLSHPEMAGQVSTLTLRYLQAMASKCLILGSAPLDAEYLFDYNPVVEVDWEDPMGQITSILENPSPYLELIERNYEAVQSRFQYQNALVQINKLVDEQLMVPAT